MSHVHLPRNSIVDKTVKDKIVFKQLWTMSFNASFDEVISMALLSIYQRWPLKMTQSSDTAAHFLNNFSGMSLKPPQ